MVAHLYVVHHPVFVRTRCAPWAMVMVVVVVVVIVVMVVVTVVAKDEKDKKDRLSRSTGHAWAAAVCAGEETSQFLR